MDKKDDTQKQSQPRYWRPQSNGDVISGTLISVERVRVNGKKLTAAILEDEDGERWSVLLGPVVLKTKWEEMRPSSGQRVTIAVTGERVSQNRGAPYLIFDLQVEDAKPESEEKKPAARA